MSRHSVLQLGELSGEVLLFGGPYSNLEAAQALLIEAERRSVSKERVICTGDVAAYCANPEETARLLNGRCVLVAGNCEKQLAADADDCGCGFEEGTACDRLSAAWYPYARAHISHHTREWFASAPDMVAFQNYGRRAVVLHGGATDIAKHVYPTSAEQVFEEEIAAATASVGPVDMIFSGHSGVAFQRQIGNVLWVNAGVIGLPPHDARNMTRFAVLSEDGVRFERLSYDHVTAATKMRRAGLPEGYSAALETGIWPSEDMLPAAMRR